MSQSHRHLAMWDEWNQRGGPRYPQEKIVQFTFRNFPPDARRGTPALDVGCGTGVHTVFLASEGFAVTAIDISPAGVEATRAALAARGMSATVREQGIADGDLPDGAFELLVCSGVLDAAGLAATASAIPSLARAMRPGGRGVFLFASERDFRVDDAGPVEIHGFTREEVETCFAEGFDEVLIDRYITTYEDGQLEQNDWLVTVRR